MEFTYKISEEDYLRACTIKVTPLPSQKLWWPKHVYRSLLFLCVFSALASGLAVGSREMSFSVSAVPPPSWGKVCAEAVTPSIIISWIYFVILGLVHRFILRRSSAQVEHYRSDPSCQCETTLTITSEEVFFRCGDGCLTRSGWNIYNEWIENGHILLLVTRARARRIVNLGGLSEAERQELRGILAVALPKR
jgi:hypothetical protein